MIFRRVSSGRENELILFRLRRREAHRCRGGHRPAALDAKAASERGACAAGWGGETKAEEELVARVSRWLIAIRGDASQGGGLGIARE
jgi:hypothetical protein